MSKRDGFSGRNIRRLLIACAIGVTSTSAAVLPVSAGDNQGIEIWGTVDRQCVDDVQVSETPVSMELVTSQAQLEEGPILTPSGSIDPMNGQITVDVPEAFFFGSTAFYLMSVEIFDDCQGDPIPFDVCFDSNATVLWPIPVSESMTFLIFFFEESPLTIDISTPPCESESEPDPDVIDEILDLVEIDDENLLRRRPWFDFSLDPYLKRVAEETLPNTL